MRMSLLKHSWKIKSNQSSHDKWTNTHKWFDILAHSKKRPFLKYSEKSFWTKFTTYMWSCPKRMCPQEKKKGEIVTNEGRPRVTDGIVKGLCYHVVGWHGSRRIAFCLKSSASTCPLQIKTELPTSQGLVLPVVTLFSVYVKHDRQTCPSEPETNILFGPKINQFGPK